MKPLFVALICVLSLGAQVASQSKIYVGLSEAQAEIPEAIRAEMEKRGFAAFDTAVISAIQAKRVPVRIVSLKKDSEYLFIASYGSETGPTQYDIDTWRSSSGRIARGTVTQSADQYVTAKARLLDPKTKEVLWSTTLEKKNRSQKQAAEALAEEFAKWMKAAKQ